jgi:hypothetical protein
MSYDDNDDMSIDNLEFDENYVMKIPVLTKEI